MSEIIISMARVSVSNRHPSLHLVLDFIEDGRREVENRPHAHVRFKTQRLAQISLDPPFDFLEGEKNVSSEISRLVRQFLRDNSGYIHFAWKLSTGHSDYDEELSGLSEGQKEAFRSRFVQDNPRFIFR